MLQDVGVQDHMRITEAYVPQVWKRLRANFGPRRWLLVEGLAVPPFGAVDVLDGQRLELGDQGV